MLPEKPASRFNQKAPLADSYRKCIGEEKPRQEQGMCLKDLAEDPGRNASASEIDTTIASLTKSEDLAWCHEFFALCGVGVV